LTAKPISIKGAKRKSGGRALKAVKLTSGDLLRCTGVLPGLIVPQGMMIAWQKSAEGVVVRETRYIAGGRFPFAGDHEIARTKARTV
jgi:hypothetical protein